MNGSILTLDLLEEGEVGEIADVTLESPRRERIRAMGFVAGTQVRVVRAAPMGDPREYELRGIRLCIRQCEAARIRLRSDSDRLQPAAGEEAS